jgi:DMSO/TMAO reductase YedYZ molybdopterin-dependent catalytic subunit
MLAVSSYPDEASRWGAAHVRGTPLGLASYDKEAIVMEHYDFSRRTLLKGGGALLAGATVLQVASPAAAFADDGNGDDGGDDLVVDDVKHGTGNPVPSGDVIPWLDQPADIPPPAQNVVGNLLKWEDLNSFVTPFDNFFTVKHYELPSVAADSYELSIEGLVDSPQSLTLDDLKSRSRRSVDFTLECSGNTGLPFFIGGIGNARWAGTPLAPLLRQARIKEEATEVVFWGADSGTVTIRDDSGITGGGKTGTVEPDAGGGLDLTITEQFARSMTLKDAMNANNLLCFEMNGEPLLPEHGFPVRLIAPGWYGVANVKWLTRIEVIDQRYTGRFMARDYVTIREQIRPDGETVWTFVNVGQDRLKSAPAKVVRNAGQYTIFGAAWGAPISAVEVKVDNGPWQPAQLTGPRPAGSRSRGFTWRFWTLPWPTPGAGTHTITSRAIDAAGNVQPAPDDPLLLGKQTYWESNGQISRTVEIT